jgi:hypothetical protein
MDLLLVGLAALAGVALLLVMIWLLVVAYAKATSSGRGIDRFFEIGDDELTPAERIKMRNNHPGAGGNG